MASPTERDAARREAPDGDALVVPLGLRVNAHPGGCGPLALTALTLERGPSHGALYVALKNEGTSLACSPAFSVELFDEAGQSVASGLGGLLVRHFYRLADGSNSTAACVGPGDVTMVAITDLPQELAIEEVTTLVYWCNYWAFEATAIDGIAISEVRAIARAPGIAYSGKFHNGFDVAVTVPSVAVFSVTAAGRPLNVARSVGASAVPPGGSWDFETDAVSEAGVAHAAYPAGGP